MGAFILVFLLLISLLIGSAIYIVTPRLAVLMTFCGAIFYCCTGMSLITIKWIFSRGMS